MPQVPGPAIRDRAARLRQAGEARVADYLASCVGTPAQVLMETPRMGRTAQFAETIFDADQPVGEIVGARLTGVAGSQLTARAG